MGSRQSKTAPTSQDPDDSVYGSSEDIDEVDDLLEEAKLSREEESIGLRNRRNTLRIHSCLEPSLKQTKSELLESQLSLNAPEIDVAEYEYPFENIVFEGGGNKGLAFSGAIRVLDEAGIWKNIRRFAGTSAGAMTASLLAVGYDYDDIRRFLNQDLGKLFLDHSCGYCSLIPNLFRHYGWNPGRRLLHWFGQTLHDQTGDKDITFKQIYDVYKKELCIMVTNVNRLDAEYCHVKTTPDMPIRLAVRMSMSIPGIFQCVEYRNNANLDLYVDGGLLCNYPIHCYDGWWLSMDQDDSFMRKLQPLSDMGRLWDRKERFGKFNNKTIGMLLFSGDEFEIMKNVLNQRPGMNHRTKRPKTKLARDRMKLKRMKEETALRHRVTLEALSKFMHVLIDNDLDKNDRVSKEELRKAFAETEVFTAADGAQLFGEKYTIRDVFDYLDVNGDGQISFAELIMFAEKKGVDLQAQFVGYERKPVKGFVDFISTLQDSLLLNVKRIFLDDRDVNRTIGVDTDYIKTTDFKMEQADKDFVVEQGARSATAFLKYYIMEEKLTPKLNSEDKTSTTNGNVDKNANTTNDNHAPVTIDVSPPQD